MYIRVSLAQDLSHEQKLIIFLKNITVKEYNDRRKNPYISHCLLKTRN
jgi:hypothetical protein